jgi:hypothetical protein
MGGYVQKAAGEARARAPDKNSIFTGLENWLPSVIGALNGELR